MLRPIAYRPIFSQPMCLCGHLRGHGHFTTLPQTLRLFDDRLAGRQENVSHDCLSYHREGVHQREHG